MVGNHSACSAHDCDYHATSRRRAWNSDYRDTSSGYNDDDDHQQLE
jgi:hypothetical protein